MDDSLISKSDSPKDRVQYSKPGILSQLMFSWVTPLTKIGQQGKLEISSLGSLPHELSAKQNHEKFQAVWDSDKAEYTRGYSKVLKCIVKIYRKEICLSLVFNFIHMFFKMGCPILIKLVVDYMKNPVEDDGGLYYGLALVFGYIAVDVLGFILEEQACFYQMILGVKSRSAILSMIYSKTLKISHTANKGFNQGEIVNFIDLDSDKIITLMWIFPQVAKLPMALFFAWGLLIYFFGVSMVGSIFIGAFMFLVNYLLAFWNASIQKRILTKKDARMQYTTESINNIRAVKLGLIYKYFFNKIQQARKEEVFLLKIKFFIEALELFCLVLTSPLLILSVFSIMFWLGKDLELSIAFVGIQMFSNLQHPLEFIPQFVKTIIEFNLSMERIYKYLNSEESSPLAITYKSEEKPAITLKNCSFAWDKPGNQSKQSSSGSEEDKNIEMEPLNKSVTVDQRNKKFRLSNISFEIFRSELICIIGEVGSGKSSLLSAILGEMWEIENKDLSEFSDQIQSNPSMKANQQVLEISGSISYVQQNPWIQNKTIKDNICGLTDEIYEEEFKRNSQEYDEVVKICQLLPDLDILPSRDHTEIGEKGINLSGGQKARISIARAIYANKDIVLLDDPLSALDSTVKGEILDKVILTKLREKTRILVTHDVSVLPKADRIIVMDKGEIKYFGSFSDLKETTDFHYINEILAKAEEEKESEKTSQDEDIPLEFEKDKEIIKDKLMKDENEETIESGWSIHSHFFFSECSWVIYLILIPIFVGKAYFMIYSTYYQAKWVEDHEQSPPGQENDKYWFYFTMCLIYPVSYCVIFFVKYLLITLTSVNKTKRIHKKMIKRVLNAPINLYFDTTPSGLILNRFSNDMSAIDKQLPDNVSSLLSLITCAAFTIYIAAMNTIYVLFLVPAILLACYLLVKYYMHTYREVSRLESITSSPRITNLSETLTGVSTIKAFQREAAFMNLNYSLLNNHAKAHFWQISMNSWVGIRTEFLSMGILIFTSVFCVVYKSYTDPIWVGILFSHFLWMTADILYAIRCFTELESDFVNYERCLNMLEICQEKDHASEPLQRNFVVDQASIEFQNYSVKYRPDTELVLKNLNFKIYPKEKVGIIGRTGAGKSTICLSLCRIIEAYSGRILVDGQDISKISLNDLRANIAVISQDPSLFIGTLKFNIDPEGKIRDGEMNEAINNCSLQDLVNRDSLGLDQTIEESGKNLSAGEKQLICICRAVLKKSKIIIMDEATANIDVKTESAIQRAMALYFENLTVITIAHRLSTIQKCDKILVLESGSLVEYESPQVLLKNPDSYFSKILNS
ncbi:unnamed protein product [Moneuplotes crassus]|uniref:Uncharacterized protein n=1 Tax=Euplotes crassus TaxID=5936 RepID=A0AAD1UD69_EUPCR|nr:unnamed protein product [Moneuplotes crassus]